jgi:hypothetical protein
MSSMKPPGTKTGLVSPGCYAAVLADCDGGPLSGEHYISETLLKRFPKTFIVEGLSWTDGPRNVSPRTLTARVLCVRHNSALSPLDNMIGDFYEVLARAHAGRDVGAHAFYGADLERWAIKVLLGLIVSGNFFGKDGQKTTVPQRYVRILFGEENLPEGCGFFYIGDPVEGLDADLLNIAINRYPPDDPEAGSVFGITIRLPSFQFVTTVTCRLHVNKQRLYYRPLGFQLGDPERGRIGLIWCPPVPNIGLVLKMPPIGSRKEEA